MFARQTLDYNDLGSPEKKIRRRGVVSANSYASPKWPLEVTPSIFFKVLVSGLGQTTESITVIP